MTIGHWSIRPSRVFDFKKKLKPLFEDDNKQKYINIFQMTRCLIRIIKNRLKIRLVRGTCFKTN